MSRMFPFITTTWNPLGGRCPHRCIYCWSQGEKGLINRYNMQKYWGEPRLIEKELNLRFKPGEFVFVQDMSDLWARKVPSEMIAKVLDVVEASPHATFLFLTKNPLRYVTFMDRLEALGNIILGCTVESNQYNWLLSEYRMGHGLVRYDEISKAPPPPKRLNVMKNIRRDHPDLQLFISVEPILDFTLTAWDSAFEDFTFQNQIRNIKPWAVAVGYDNYGHKLPEPPLDKTLKLIEELEKFTKVYRKTLRRAWYERK